MLNLFLALLLSSFGGDALKGDEDEGAPEKKKSRLQRLIDWTKKRKKKKSPLEVEKDPDANMVGYCAKLFEYCYFISVLDSSSSYCYFITVEN